MRPQTFYARVSKTETVSFIFKRNTRNVNVPRLYDVDIWINARVNSNAEGEVQSEDTVLMRLQIGHFTNYKPGLSVKTTRQMAGDVLTFVEAYLDRPMEFERELMDEEGHPAELEQKYSQVWRRIMDNLRYELERKDSRKRIAFRSTTCFQCDKVDCKFRGNEKNTNGYCMLEK